MQWILVVLTLGFAVAQSQNIIREKTCTSGNQKAVIQSGSPAMIGGLISMHRSGNNGYGCGSISTGMMQSYEAIRWALDRLNKKNQFLNGENLTNSYIPGIALGMTVYDYCGRSSSAISNAQEMYPQFSSESRDCTKNSSSIMLGLVGASSSSVTKDLNAFTSQFNVPLVSYMASAAELSNNAMYPNFMRTVSPDGPLMDAIIAVMDELKWQYVVVVYTDDTYGRGAFDELRPRMVKAGKCLTMGISTGASDTSTATMNKVLAKTLSTETTGVIYFGGSQVANALLEVAESYPNAGKLQWIFTDSVSLSNLFTGKKYPRGIISVLSGSRKITEFEDHWVRIDVNSPSPENPWYQDWYMTEHNCRLPSNTNPAFNGLSVCPTLTESQRRNEFVQDQFVEPAVHAVFGYAYALRRAHADKCGSGNSGLCPQLAAMTTKEFYSSYLRNVSFTYTKMERVESLASVGLEPYNAAAKVKFDANGDIVGPTYDVYNFNDYPGGAPYKFRRLGSYLNGRLEIVTSRIRMYNVARDNSLNPLPSSPCPSSGCRPCLGMPGDSLYMYKPGDIVITGMFSIHKRGQTPLSCGAFDTSTRSGIQYMEAMFYAINQVNTNFRASRNILRGVNLGGLAFDDCMDPSLGSHFITEVARSARMITDQSGVALDPNTVESYMGAHTSYLTVPLANLMNRIKKPLLGYAGTSPKLDNYPYYRYILLNRQYILKALVLMIKRLGWNYVQVLQTELKSDDYFDVQFMTFKRLAAEEKICVVARHMFEDNMAEVIDKLKGHSSVKPVVLLASFSDIRSFLTKVKEMNMGGHFHYLTIMGLDATNYFQGIESIAEGLLTVNVQGPDMAAFSNYLSTLRPTAYTANPWFNEWYENMFNCSLDSSSMRMYSVVCNDPSNTPITANGKVKIFHYLYSSVYSVYAIAQGLHETLVQFCGVNYNGVCSNFMNAADKGDVLLDKIDNTLLDISGTAFKITDKNANFPVIFSNYRNGLFRRVGGDYNFETSQFSLTVSDIRLYGNILPADITPHCRAVCTECLYIFSNQDYMFIDGDLIIPAMFDVHYPGNLPYLCGDLRFRNGFLNTEAFKFAIERINNGQANVTLNNVRLGALGFDGCMDNNRALTIVAGLYAGIYPLENGKFEIPLQKLLGWLPYSDDFTISLGSLNLMNLITPAATSPVLDNKATYTTFFRTIPSDGLRAMAMAKVAMEMGYKYIITLNAPDRGSRDSVAAFKKYLDADGICVGASYEFETDGTTDQLISYIVASSTRVVAVFSDPDRYIEKLLLSKGRNAFASNIIFMTNRVWSEPTISRNAIVNADRSLMFGHIPRSILEFQNYLRNKFPTTYTDNPWFDEFYEQYFTCDLGESWKYGVKCTNPSGQTIINNNFKEEFTTLSTIHAVTSMADAVHSTLKEKCGTTYSGVCSKFLTDLDTSAKIRSYLDSQKFYDVLGEMFSYYLREVNKGINVYFFSAYTATLEGSFDHKSQLLTLADKTDLMTKQGLVPSTCIGDCAVCFKGDTTQKFTYYNADIMFVGLFDVHKPGPTPYTCGEINDKHGFQLVEAFHYAIDYINNKKGIFQNLLPGVTVGGIALDVCQSPTRAGNMVANIHSKNLELKKDGIVIDPSRFDVYIGTQQSESSIRVADVLKALNIPQISYGASSLRLRNSRKYQYFLRTVPADDKLARSIISYLKRFDLRNVQVIHTFESIGQTAREEFARLAYLNRVCIAQNITVGKDGPVNNARALTALNGLSSNLDAKIVILFVDEPRPFLEEIEKSQYLRNNFKFIGTDKWGEDPDMWENLPNIMREKNVVTFDVETADITGFDKYLEYKTPDTYSFNPWFNEYYEYIYNCSLTGASSQKAACPSRQYGIPRSPHYIQDPYVLYVINAVFTAAIGTHNALFKLCPEPIFGLCNLFLRSGEKRQQILSGAKLANFTDDTHQPFYFTPDGESDRGFHIWQSLDKPDGTGYYLEDVGSYNDTHYLKIDARYDPGWMSPCEGVASCNCTFPSYQPSRYMLKPSPENLNILYISDIHKAYPNDPYSCGDIDTAGNFQNLMAFFYAINLVNTNQDLKLPASLKLGGMALDTCSTPSRIGQDLYSLLSGESICSAQGTGQVIDPSTVVVHMAKNSANSIVTSSILSPLGATTLSQSATSVELSDKDYHSYFLRTVPPDDIQAVVMAQVVQKFGWDYVSMLYTNNAYGRAAKDTFLANSENASPRTCTAIAISMETDATLDDFKSALDDLNQRVGARVVILFLTTSHVQLLLRATKEKGLQNRFVWFGSETWSNSMLVVKGYEDAATGALTIQIRSEVVESFKAYMKALTFHNRMGLPNDWFEDIYQTLHQCRILNSVVRKTFTRICSEDEKITDDMIPQDPFVLHTIIAVFTVAQGLNQVEVCKSSSLDIAACLSLQDNKLDLIYKGILSSQYNVLPQLLGNKSFQFKFTESGYGDIGYNILNFRRDLTSGSGDFQYVSIGSYQQELQLDRSLYKGFSFVNTRSVPNSECPVGGTCRCLNRNGSTTSYSRQGVSGTSYYVLEDGSYVDAQTGAIVQIESVPNINDRFTDIWGIIVATLAGIGIFAALCVFVYLLVVYPVRSGTTVLGYMLAFGIVLMYAMVFAFIVHATEEVCGLRRFCLGFVYAICYCALFVKLVDCWRTKEKDDIYAIKYEKLGKPLGLFFVALLLVLVQCMINAEWLILEEPKMDRILYNSMLWPRCMPHDYYDQGLILSLVYIMFIIVLSFFIGLMTWRSKKNHREARWILGIFVLSIPVWVVFCVVACLGAYKMRDAAIAIGLLINATIMFMLGPMRKLYLLNKFEAKMEEEERKSIVGSQKGGEYSSMYGRQYDNMAQLHETNSMRGSIHGSGIQGSFHGQQRSMYYQEEKTISY